MKNSICRLSRPILGILLGVAFSHPFVSADFVVSMTGAVGDGDLNGVRLAGQAFEFQGLITAIEDADNFEDFGLFIFESASFEFAGGSHFEFDQNDSALGVVYDVFEGQLVFGAGIIADDLPSPNGYFNFLQFFDSDISDTGEFFDGFDPEILTPIAYSDFDTGSADLSAMNSLGDQLAISELSLPISFSVTAIPEPTSLPIVFSVVAMLVFRRRRWRSVSERISM